ncbi:MAG: DUF1501 domain-containing protein [Acidimicrobiales bacterium]|nr:DUF1501 domain-containing protein [Acidimicrobiales bacterium]
MTDHDDPRPRPQSDPPATPGPDGRIDGPPPPSRLEMPAAPPTPGAAEVPPPPPAPAAPGSDGARRRPLSRRTFLGVAGGVAGTAAVGGGVWAVLMRDSVESAGVASTTTTVPTTTTTLAAGGGAVPYGDRILVVLEMAGGNDALNTLVSNDGAYRSARPQLALPENELLALAGADFGLHPSLAGLVPYWDAGTMAAVAGAGMPEQSRSHFKAMDTWWSGIPGAGSQTGWLGRWLDATLEGANDPLRAIALGGGSPALVGMNTLATVVRSPETFTLRTMEGADNDALVAAFLATAGPLSASPEMAAAQYAIPSTLDAVEILASVSGGGEEYDINPAPSTATSLLQTAAGIIDLGIGTQVITVGINGFDTHANQLGTHAGLLADVGDGLAAFFDRLEADGHADRVMVVTTSEFGRRVAENGSGGTDHGSGGCQFLIGPDVAGAQVIGGYDFGALTQGDIPAVVDTRSIYSAALDWMGGPTDEILDGPHDRLGLLSA